jgi:hypothetical protein
MYKGPERLSLTEDLDNTMRTNEPDATKDQSAPAASRRARRPPATAAPRTKARRAAPPQSIDWPGDEEIRRRAYLFYLDRHGAPGDPVADWLRAERELTAETAHADASNGGNGSASRKRA